MQDQKKGTGKKIAIFILIWGFALTIATYPLSQAPDRKKPVGTIKGRILDYESQKPLIGVSVAVLDSQWKARSDANGTYELTEVPVGYYVVAYELDGYYIMAGQLGQPVGIPSPQILVNNKVGEIDN